MSDQATLEVYDAGGALVRTVAMRRDEQDASKWHLAESVSLGSRHAETAVVRHPDGTSTPVPPSMFAAATPINTIFL